EVHFKRGGLSLRARPPVRAVDGVSFEVRRGEALGRVGDSGSGKSPPARAILQLMPLTGGKVRLDDETISGKRERALKPTKRRLQMVLHDPYGSPGPRLCIVEIVAEPLIVHAVARGREATRRATELLEIVG